MDWKQIYPWLAALEPGLRVHYVPSASAQDLEIRLEVRANDAYGDSAILARDFLQTIDLGFAAGAEFDPSASRVRLFDGDYPDPARPETLDEAFLRRKSYIFRSQITAVSPFYIRVLVEHLGTSASRLEIIGSAPPQADVRAVVDGHSDPRKPGPEFGREVRVGGVTG